jgi:4-amino-4-deoxy-L-arabinose transferase-like glycosyltransferase
VTGAGRNDEAPASLKRAVIALFLLLLALRAVTAARLQLFGDEAFYWLCAQHPALGYVDHPFVTALSVRLGTLLLGDSPFGLRLLFLACGALLPWAVLALARPIVGGRDAWLAAGASLVVPIFALAGSVAVPDAPLLLLAPCTALCLERALRTGRLFAWLGTGAATALGLCTHYRFALVALAAAGVLLLTRDGRRAWRTPGPWIAGAIAGAGLAPALLFNAALDWQPLRYQAGSRHVDAQGPRAWLLHPLEQATVTTPLLYAALLLALWSGLRAMRAGDRGRALLGFFALVPLGTYWALSAVSDTGHDYMHWPAVGYLPLLPLVPDVLRGWAARGGAARLAARAAPVLGLAVALLAFADLATGVPGLRFLHGPFDGWDELADSTRAKLAAGTLDEPPALLLADNYIAAAQLQYLLGAEVEVYVADHPMNERHGRGLQFRLWGRDEAGFLRHAGERALVVKELTEKPRPMDSATWAAHLGLLVHEAEPLGVLHCEVGKRRFSFQAGLVRPPPAAPH